jgi:hypothetical protein
VRKSGSVADRSGDALAMSETVEVEAQHLLDDDIIVWGDDKEVVVMDVAELISNDFQVYVRFENGEVTSRIVRANYRFRVVLLQKEEGPEHWRKR